MRNEMEELLRLLDLPREQAGYRYFCEAASVYRQTGLDGAALLDKVASACGVPFSDVNLAIGQAVGYIQKQPSGSRLLRERSIMGTLRWMLQLCLHSEEALAPPMAERFRLLLDNTPAPC